MSYILEFKLLGLPKMTNGSGRVHWSLQHKRAMLWKSLVKCGVKDLLPAKPLVKAKLTLTRHSGNCPDSDGLVSGFKHVIDGLVEAKVLENDKFSNIGMPDYRWEKAPLKKGFITIKVEEISA